MPVDLFRVVLPVRDIDKGVDFYSRVLGDPGKRISENRHYFHCSGTILALVEPPARGHPWIANPEVTYFAVPYLEEVFERAKQAGCTELEDDDVGWGIRTRHWGERSFYIRDVFGNPICFVDERTLFTGAG